MPRFTVSGYIARSRMVMDAFAADTGSHRELEDIAFAISTSIDYGGKLLIAGNGGSASDATHIAAEFVARFTRVRRPIGAIALAADGSVLTAIGNDFDFERVFARQVKALGRKGDVFLAISTSGNSPNIIRALEAARDEGLVTVGFAAGTGGGVADLCDHLFLAPTAETALAQQVHIVAAHIVCALVEGALAE